VSAADPEYIAFACLALRCFVLMNPGRRIPARVFAFLGTKTD
jgi:hypothetical protein